MNSIQLLVIENKTFYLFFNVFLFLVFLFLMYKLSQRLYYRLFNKSIIVHFYPFKKTLPQADKAYLLANFKFYKNLVPKRQRFFEHRVTVVLNKKEFIARQDFQITQEVKLLISATAVMLTFGMKNYIIKALERVIIYPKVFYSTINDDHHKGEFNPSLKAIVFSWEDFVSGYDIDNDNLNLGIHEFTHAIHFNSLSQNDYSSKIFKKSFNDLTLFLSKNEALRKELIASKYFRDYAFTNQFEFLAVLIENFIETPEDFKSHFPNLYEKVKQLLKFNFAKY
ncbi:zinc-dependent peptidase [Aurantibacter sp.]|uniref:zinc-dependent peptidase n=1 Tax=Aurantibacter sp. TaxID=2807103 RepID=UPI0035C791F4